MTPMLVVDNITCFCSLRLSPTLEEKGGSSSPALDVANKTVNELNVQRTVREPFGGKFVYVRSFNKRTNMNKKFPSIS